MIKFEYIPEDKKYYTPIKLELNLSDDSDINEHFEAWKKFMYTMTFSGIDSYILEKENNEAN